MDYPPIQVAAHTHSVLDIDGLETGQEPAEYTVSNGFTAKHHFGQTGSGGMHVGSNVDINDTVLDGSVASWRLYVSQSSDNFRIERSAVGAGWVPTALLTLDNTGAMSVRNKSRVSTTSSSATPTINTDTTDHVLLTAQAAAITSFTTNLSGTPNNGDKLWISITGTAARAITWGSKFEASTVALPTTTVLTNRLDVEFIWNATTSKWRCVRAV